MQQSSSDFKKEGALRQQLMDASKPRYMQETNASMRLKELAKQNSLGGGKTKGYMSFRRNSMAVTSNDFQATLDQLKNSKATEVVK